MFMGPFEKEKVWSTDAVTGCKRFLNRFYDLVHSEKVSDEDTEEALKLGHRLVDMVTKDIEALQFNTAIARMMEFLNDFTPLSLYPRSVLKQAVQVLHPFAPHLAEELWQVLGEKELLAYAPIPPVDPRYLVDANATYVVQINGKLRGRFDLPKGLSEQQFLAFVKKQPQLANYLQGEIVKTVYVPNKILNLVIK
jgi:leucyl-tRNA synthetase